MGVVVANVSHSKSLSLQCGLVGDGAPRKTWKCFDIVGNGEARW